MVTGSDRPAATPAVRALSEAGIEHVVLTMAEARRADAAAIHKTLVAAVDDRPVVAIVGLDGRLSLKALARAASGKRAVMVEPADAERLTGYVTGGISPFGQRRALPTYLDDGALAYERIYVSAGQRGLEVGVAPGALVALLAATVARLGA
jgi:Cys-tRNA(Pro)/Cys-tRNA(Cys) deacylase